MEPIFFQNIAFAYPGKPPLWEALSLTLPGEGIVAVTGPSGCGKTTLLRLLAGLEMPDTGEIAGLSGRRVAMVFQEDRLLPWMTALDNVAAARRGGGARERALDRLRAVRLEEQAAWMPAALSGGMKRRVAIARALATDADLLLLDEPFNGLDAALWGHIAETIRAEYAPGSGRLAVLVTHSPAQITALGAAEVPLPPPDRSNANEAM